MTNSEKHILIVEDSEETARLLMHCLTAKGFRVSWVGDGADGLRVAVEARPDLVILDLGLPGLSGEEVCRTIKDSYDREIREIPILVVTGKSAEADRVLVRAYGADAFVSKPFDLGFLVGQIEELLGLSV